MGGIIPSKDLIPPGCRGQAVFNQNRPERFIPRFPGSASLFDGQVDETAVMVRYYFRFFFNLRLLQCSGNFIQFVDIFFL